jgi:hypothetical protein
MLRGDTDARIDSSRPRGTDHGRHFYGFWARPKDGQYAHD